MAHFPIARPVVPGGVRRQLALVGLLAAVAALLVAELEAPRDVSLGSAVLVPIAIAARLLKPRAMAAVVVAAVAGRWLAAAVGDLSPWLATVDVASYAMVTAVASVDRWRSWKPSGARPWMPATPDVSMPLLLEGRLTAREREVTAMAMRGLSAVAIAQRLHISRRTVETHLARAYPKLGFRSKQELVAHYVDLEVAPPSGAPPGWHRRE